MLFSHTDTHSREHSATVALSPLRPVPWAWPPSTVVGPLTKTGRAGVRAAVKPYGAGQRAQSPRPQRMPHRNITKAGDVDAPHRNITKAGDGCHTAILRRLTTSLRNIAHRHSCALAITSTVLESRLRAARQSPFERAEAAPGATLTSRRTPGVARSWPSSAPPSASTGEHSPAGRLPRCPRVRVRVRVGVGIRARARARARVRARVRVRAQPLTCPAKPSARPSSTSSMARPHAVARRAVAKMPKSPGSSSSMRAVLAPPG
jgi:hypothetical protein